MMPEDRPATPAEHYIEAETLIHRALRTWGAEDVSALAALATAHATLAQVDYATYTHASRIVLGLLEGEE